MKVLQICAAYKPAFIYGGPTMSVSMLSERLTKAGFSTEVYTTTANGKEELPVPPNVALNVDAVTVTYFKRITKDHTHFSPAMLKKLWRSCRDFDLIHIHTWWNLVSVLACAVARIKKVPVLLSPRGTLSPYSFQNKNIGLKSSIHALFGKSLLNRCHVHVTSERENEATKKLIDPKSITILPNFIKLPGQRAYTEKESSNIFKILFFSRIEEKKGLDILINSLSNITVPYRLTVAGDGDNTYIDSLKSIAGDNGVADNISWVGFQGENKFDLLHDHDLFVLPSYDENFGNTVIESLSVGTPVLISEQVGLADYVKKNDLGWICQTTPLSVSRAINEITVKQKDHLRRIRKNAPGIIYNDFDEDNLVRRYVNMYNNLVKQ